MQGNYWISGDFYLFSEIKRKILCIEIAEIRFFDRLLIQNKTKLRADFFVYQIHVGHGGGCLVRDKKICGCRMAVFGGGNKSVEVLQEAIDIYPVHSVFDQLTSDAILLIIEMGSAKYWKKSSA